MAIKTTITVKLGVKQDDKDYHGGKGGYLSAEVDSRSNGYNQGKTEFSPGDPVYFLVFKSPDVTVEVFTSIDKLGGSAKYVGGAEVPETDTIVIDSPDEREGSLGKPCGAAPVVTWMGNNLGQFVLQDDAMTLKLPELPSLKPSDPPHLREIGVAEIQYSAAADVYKLTTVDKVNGKSEYEVQIVITGLVTP